MPNKSFYLPKTKYSKTDNPFTGFSYNQSSYAGGFRNDCSGFVSDVLRTNGYNVPKDFNTSNIKAWAANPNPYFDSVGTGSRLKITDFKDGDLVMLGSGHTGVVFTDEKGIQSIADWGTSSKGFRSKPVELEYALKNGWFGLPINEVIRLKPETYHAENDQTLPGHGYANPAWHSEPIPLVPKATNESRISKEDTDPMGSDDSKSIMDAVSNSPSAQTAAQPDANYSHEGRNSSSPAGDAMDARLPDGTRVVSISTTVNGQTNVAAELIDKDGRVLLSAGPGQTMLRDPDTGIVQVRMGSSDQVQQYDPSTGEISKALRNGSHAAQVYENLVDIFSNPQVSADKGVQIADASGEIPDTFAKDINTNHHTFNNYLNSQNNLTSQQQDALANQLEQLGLGGDNDLSFYRLAGGGAIITNADGEIVGEINCSKSGDIAIRATGIDEDGNTVEVNKHISEQGIVQTQEQYNTAIQRQASDMLNSLISVQQWNHLSDVGKLCALANLYNTFSKLGDTFDTVGKNLGSDLGSAASYLQLVQSLQSGDSIAVVNSINALSDGALESALNKAFGNTAASQAVPYLSYALAIRNFAEHPEQAITSMAGLYAGEALGMAIGEPIGAAIGGAIGGMIGDALGGLFGGSHSAPPPPEGVVNFSWDGSGHLQHTIERNQSSGGMAANQVAASVQNMLQELVDTHNTQHPTTADDIAINPYFIPKIGFSGSCAWMEVVLSDGSTVREGINQENFTERLLGLLLDNGGLAPAWQVKTQLIHYQLKLQDGQSQALAEAQLRLGAGGQASPGNEAFGLQGNAVESADFKSQTFGALVVHLNDNPAIQEHTTTLSQVLRDVEGDGYFEQTQAVAAKDSAGNLQAVLTIDFNGDGVIEVRDLLNLGGNNAADKPTDHTQMANVSSDQQRNNVQWLDANGDGVLDKSDPAFAAIKLWVDINQDGMMQAEEGQSLTGQQISSINFKTGDVTYEDGHTDALTAQTLRADTEGVKYTHIQVVNQSGDLYALDAGDLLEHEGYQGKVQISDEGSTRWVSKRIQSYQQVAKRTGDWEGTAEQAEHRHGGGNVEGEPTQTAATGATDFGLVKSHANEVTQSTVTEGDARVVSDAPTHAPKTQANAQVVVNAGDIRIKSNAATINTLTTNSATRVPDARIAFVPTAKASVQNEIKAVTNSMIQSAQSIFFSVDVNAGLGVLAAVGMGAVQNIQAAVQPPTLISDVVSTNIVTIPGSVSSNYTFSNETNSGLITNTASAVFKQMASGVLYVPPGTIKVTPATSPQNTPASAPDLANEELKSAALVGAAVIVSAPEQSVFNIAPGSLALLLQASPDRSMQAVAIPIGVNTVNYPVVQAETLYEKEDEVLRLTASVLLANDSTLNASADTKQPALSITAVSGPQHGQVSLVDGELLFAPDKEFHGIASFTYRVTDQYGLSTEGRAILDIAPVNDVPTTQSEVYSSEEDTEIIFTQAQLLANDSDVDIFTDEQVLRISAVGCAANGTVTMLSNGNIRFVTSANYHGLAEFTYEVSDGNGGKTDATVNINITAVNDRPVVHADALNTNEDTPLLIASTNLLANDSDVDADTDSQVLSISAVRSIAGQTHGTVNLLSLLDGTQTVQFTPDADYHGLATFNYTVSDGNGGFAMSIATINIASVNDPPNTQGEFYSSDEDTGLIFTQTQLLANDGDVDVQTDGQVLRISALSDATHGVVSMLANGDIRFVPAANYHGPAEFTYTVSDGNGGATDAKVNLTISAVNDMPVAVGDLFTTAEDSTTVLTAQQLLGNDSDYDVTTDSDVLCITRVFAPQHCTATLNADGTINLTPDANYHGTVRFSYEITDKQGATSTAFVIAGISPVNDAPVSQPDSYSNLEDNIIMLSQDDLLGNDKDSDIDTDGDMLHVAAVSNATNGQVTLLPNGQIEFVPDNNFHGVATFDYVVSDSFGAISLSTVSLHVGALNDMPVVQNEFFQGSEDNAYVTNASVLLANDSDVDTATDGQLLSVTQVQNAQHGVVEMDVNGRITFTPDDNYHGNASFDYVVSDGNGSLITGRMSLNLQAVNDAPVTRGESYLSDEDTDLNLTQAQLLANDSDVDTATDGQILSISHVGQAEHGTVWLDISGNLRFVPDTNYHGPAKFTYWVGDGEAASGAGDETPATVNWTIAAVNDMPVVEGEAIDSVEDTCLLIDAATLLANDSDVDGATDLQLLSISGLSNAAHCTVNLVTQSDSKQQIIFVPEANYHGSASFNYTVTDSCGGAAVATAVVNLSSVNDAPVTTGETASGVEDHTLVFRSQDLLANDIDVDTLSDSQVLSISRLGNSEHGTLYLDAQGQVHFTPDANYHGAAQFTYWVSDGAGAETPATLTLTLMSANDLPVVTGEVVSANEDTTLLFDPATLLANDVDVDSETDGQVLSITAVSNPTHGSVAFVTQADGNRCIAFTPEVNYFGVASYQYTVSDGAGGSSTGTVMVYLAPVNDTPSAADDNLDSTLEDVALHIRFESLLGNDNDADSDNSQRGGIDDALTISAVGNAVHGRVSIVNGEVIFTPDGNYHGTASFAYQVTDSSGAFSQAMASFTVTAVNDAPVAVSETVSINEDTPLIISPSALLQNDTDVDVSTDGQVLSISAVSNAQHGTVLMNADGTISFVPDPNFYGNASFDYIVNDSFGSTAITTAVIAVASVNDSPVATGETVNSMEDQVLNINALGLLQNDNDVDNDRADLRISRVQSGAGGTVSLNASGNLVFTPTANYNGTATFTYWVKDPGGLESNPVTTKVVLAAVNDAPSAQGEIVSGASEDAVFNINKTKLLANDHDIDDSDNALSLSWVGNATGGSVSLDASGSVVFTPTANFNGNASFQYKVRDTEGLESPLVTAVVPVAAVNDAPVAADDQFTTYNNSTLTVAFNQLTGNDRDIEGDALTVSEVRDHANGHAAIVNGQVQFVANAGFTGQASFEYLADDGHGGQAWATAFVDVKAPPNRYPTAYHTSGNGWGYYPWLQWVQINFKIDDDTVDSAATVRMQLVSASFHNEGVAKWKDATNSYNLSRSGDGGYFKFSDYFDQLKTDWLLTDERGLTNHFYFEITGSQGDKNNWIFNSFSSNEHYGYYYPPLVLDLNGDGIHFTSIQNSNVKLDVNFDGIEDKLAWVGNDDGVLVWDKDHNHCITDASEFGFQGLKAGAQTDLEGLQALDTNSNGLLDAGDDKFAELAVWQDANGNGVTDTGEFKTLNQLGIANINLHSDGQMRDAGSSLANSRSGETDATVMGNTSFTRSDGSTGVAADTMLAFEPGCDAPAITHAKAQAQIAEVVRQALLFNQFCNTVIDIDNYASSYLPIETDVQMHDMWLVLQNSPHEFTHAV